jgi:Beta-lactamase
MATDTPGAFAHAAGGRVSASVVFAGTAPAPAEVPAGVASPQAGAKIDVGLLRNVVAASVPGVVVRVEPGREIRLATAGVSNLTTCAPLRAHARIRVGSITKTFVAAVVLQLVDEGRLDLDQPVERWRPGLLGRWGQHHRQAVAQLHQRALRLHQGPDRVRGHRAQDLSWFYRSLMSGRFAVRPLLREMKTTVANPEDPDFRFARNRAGPRHAVAETGTTPGPSSATRPPRSGTRTPCARSSRPAPCPPHPRLPTQPWTEPPTTLSAGPPGQRRWIRDSSSPMRWVVGDG